ncbi:Uncharacterised protein [Segatella copri]|nr:Uncharacterised protein [Segatella copri]
MPLGMQSLRRIYNANTLSSLLTKSGLLFFLLLGAEGDFFFFL